MEEIDHFDNPYWEPLQVMAWMCLRNKNYVHQASSLYSNQEFFYAEVNTPSEKKKLREIQSNLFSTRKIDIIMACDGSYFHFENVNNANQTLHRALQEGKITAYGSKKGTGEFEPIKDYLWAELTIIWNDLPNDSYAQSIGYSDHSTSWYGLKFKRGEVLSNWPDIIADEGPSIRYGSASAKRQCTLWLIELMEIGSTTIKKNNDNKKLIYIDDHNKSAPYLNNDDMYEIAKSKFPGLSKNSYKAAKAQAIEETSNTNWNKSAKKPTKK